MQWILKKLMVAGVLGLALLGAQPQAAKADSVKPVQTSNAEDATYWVAGPYYTYTAAYVAASNLADLGYYTQIVYRGGFYYVVYA
jgi:hypothetical protein